MKPIVPSQLVAGAILAEATPISRGLASVYRGADLGPGLGDPRSVPTPRSAAFDPYRERGAETPPPRAVPVIVRRVNETASDGAHYAPLFRQMTLARLRMTGSPAPRLLHTFGLGERVFASVEEYVWGTPLEEVLRALGASGAQMPVSVALAIGQGLLPLWMRAVPDGIRVSADPQGVLFDVRGEVRVIPSYHQEQTRHAVGAALLSLQSLVTMTSPEEVRGGEPDSRSAMFYLGLLLYEMLAGAHPFASGKMKLFEVLSELAERDAPHLRKHRSDVHPTVAEFVHRCLARDASQRFTSWQELLAASPPKQSGKPPLQRWVQSSSVWARSGSGHPPPTRTAGA